MAGGMDSGMCACLEIWILSCVQGCKFENGDVCMSGNRNLAMRVCMNVAMRAWLEAWAWPYVHAMKYELRDLCTPGSMDLVMCACLKAWILMCAL